MTKKEYFDATIAVIVAGYFSMQLFKFWRGHVTPSLRNYPFLEVASSAAIFPLCISCISISLAACLMSDKIEKRLGIIAIMLAASLLLCVWVGISFSTFMWVFGWLGNQADSVGGGIVALMLAMLSAAGVFVTPIWLFDKVRRLMPRGQ